MKTHITSACLIAAACTSMALAGPVVQLNPGDSTNSLSGITNSQMSELIGVTQFDSYQSFAIDALAGGDLSNSLYAATLLTRVVRSNQTGMLTMNFQILDVDGTLSGSISHIDISGFTDMLTRVEYRNEITGPTLFGPDSASRSEDGSVLSFGFGNGLGSDASSKFFFAMLDVAEYDFAAMMPQATVFLSTGESVSFDINPPVPSPGPMALLGVAGLCFSRRRR